MLETIENQTGADPKWSVIWLHGLGADGSDFVPLVPELVRGSWPALRFIFPHAPIRAVTVNNGHRMRAWYDILSLDFTARREDEAGLRESIAQCRELIAREIARGIPSERIFLAGFSQGGAIALACALRYEHKLAGCIALSTYLSLADATASERSSLSETLPIFMAHGRVDPIVPIDAGVRSRNRLQSWGMDVSWRDYPMQHSVCGEEVNDLAQWMGQIFKYAAY